jgi:hypothetical protein
MHDRLVNEVPMGRELRAVHRLHIGIGGRIPPLLGGSIAFTPHSLGPPGGGALPLWRLIRMCFDQKRANCPTATCLEWPSAV